MQETTSCQLREGERKRVSILNRIKIAVSLRVLPTL